MKREHPELYEVEVTLSNGSVEKVYLTKKVDSLRLDIDFINHPAWNKEKDNKDMDVFAEINKFKEKFDLDI